MRTLYARLAVCLALIPAFALGWTTEGRAGETASPSPCKSTLYMAAKDPPSNTKAPEDAATKVSKQLTAIQEQITALQTEEFQITTKILPAVENAKKTGKIEDPAKVRDEMGKAPSVKSDWKDYKQVYLAAAQQWQALAEKYNRLKPQLKALERDRDSASPDSRALIDTLSKRIPDKIRALIERAGDAYNQVGEFKKALPIFTSVYQEIPEEKRGAEKVLTEKLADLCDKTGDTKTALRLYEALYKAASETERKAWATFETRKRLAALYEKMADSKTALDFYKGLLETFEPAKRDTDGKWIKDKIAACEARVNQGSGTPTGSKGTPTPKKAAH
jgi:tetratricopeptide (TPR) repeat protein